MTIGSGTDITLESRLAGAAWGHLVGDAVGVPYEFTGPRDPGEVRFGATGTWGKPAGTWSDDGALMLALLDSLLDADPEQGEAFDLDDQGGRALAWDRDGAYTPDHEGRFDIGGTTRVALRRLRNGVPAADGPLRVDVVDLAGVTGLGAAPGTLGITFLPGEKGHGHAGPHWRDLDLDLARLRELGVDVLCLLHSLPSWTPAWYPSSRP
jgi:hypothetical protein